MSAPKGKNNSRTINADERHDQDRRQNSIHRRGREGRREKTTRVQKQTLSWFLSAPFAPSAVNTLLLYALYSADLPRFFLGATSTSSPSAASAAAASASSAAAVASSAA